MSLLGSVSIWLGRLHAGDRDAVEAIWQRYFRQLVHLARERLRGFPRAAADEEDIALSAFDSFFRRAQQGAFPRLSDRHDLWAILVRLTLCKTADLVEHEQRDKRDWRRVLSAEAQDDSADTLLEWLSRDPDPALAAAVADRLRYLLGLLPDEECRLIAQRKLDGFTNQEIADQLDCADSTVERRLVRIRKTWLEKTADEEIS